eukprot:m.168644 g.168644  ORF g.168644 m.168644 type:complete len:562 (+) comp18215_c0_seq1:288-1973(+)
MMYRSARALCYTAANSPGVLRVGRSIAEAPCSCAALISVGVIDAPRHKMIANSYDRFPPFTHNYRCLWFPSSRWASTGSVPPPSAPEHPAFSNPILLRRDRNFEPQKLPQKKSIRSLSSHASGEPSSKGAPARDSHSPARHSRKRQQRILSLSDYNRRIHRCARVGNTSAVMYHLKCLLEHGFQPDEVTYNSIINACAQSGDGEAAVKWFNTMRENGIPPSTMAYNSVLNAFAQIGDTAGTVYWFDKMATNEDCILSGTAYSTVIHAFAKRGDAASATAWFEAMTEKGFQPTVLTYSSVINAYAKSGDTANAVRWFDLLSKSGVQPTETTYSTVINAFAQVGNSAAAVEWFNKMVTKGIRPNVVSYSAVINAFVQSKDCTNTVLWFEKMVAGGIRPSVVSYGCVINAFADVGDCDRALAWVDRMTEDDIEPTQTVYNTVLKACSLASPVDVTTAFRIADKMVQQRVPINDYSMTMLLRCCALADPKLPRVAEEVFKRHVHTMENNSKWSKISAALFDAVGATRARALLQWARRTLPDPAPTPRPSAAQTEAMYTTRHSRRP